MNWKISPVCTKAFTLVEVTLALGVAAISVIAIFALLPVGLQTSYNATEQTASTDIIASVIADLRATPSTSTTSAQFGISIPGSSGTSTVTTLYFSSEGKLLVSSTGARYRLTATFPSNSTTPRGATFSDLKMTWPAAANPTNASGSAEMFVALDRN